MLADSQIHRFLILHKELDPDDDELTRTRKVRRNFVAEKYGRADRRAVRRQGVASSSKPRSSSRTGGKARSPPTCVIGDPRPLRSPGGPPDESKIGEVILDLRTSRCASAASRR
jgi:hypothetical protein